MHTVQLLLKTSKYERHEIDRRFHALAHLHNVCVKHARKCMIRLQHDKRYAELRQLYNELVKKEKMSKEEKSQKKKLAKQLAACRTEQGLSKASLEHYIKVCGKQFSKLLSSQQVQAEADRVWCGVERCLFGNGKELHFKKLMDFDTIGGKSNKNGARFDLDAMYVNWLGLSLKCYLPKSENSLSYVWESLKGKISYCNIKRLMFSSGWRYYAEIVVSGAAPTRVLIGTSTMGIDPGVSTIAGVSEDACVLEELAPNAIQYEKKIQKISQRMDRSRRISNPNKYNEDGTINRSNRDPWKYSKNYVKMCRLLKSLYRKNHAYIVDSHRKLCNKLITIAKYFSVEKMHFQALQKRAKETKRQEKKTEVTVFAAKSLNGVMDELCEKYNSEHPNVTFQTNYDSSGTLMTQIKEGAKCNIFFSAGVSQMDELQAGFDGGDIVEGSRRDLLNNQVCLVTWKGSDTKVTDFSNLSLAKNMALADQTVPVGQKSTDQYGHGRLRVHRSRSADR